MKWGNVKDGIKDKQTLDTRNYPVILVDAKSPLVHVIEAVTKSIAFRSPSLFRYTPSLATKAHPKFPVTLMVSPLRSFSMKGRDLHVPDTKVLLLLNPKPESQ